jgi:hypothetical protein
MITVLLLLIPGLVASPTWVAIARSATRHFSSFFSPLILPTSSPISPLLIPFDNKAVLRLSTIALTDLNSSILNEMRLLGVKHLPIEFNDSLTVGEVAVRVLLHLLLGGIHNKGDKGESSRSPRVFVSHDCNINQFSYFLEIVFNIRF